METYCSIWVFLFCKHPMRAVLYKTNKPKSIYQDFGLFVLYNRAMGCSPRNRKSRLTANDWDDRRNSSPLILVEMAKAVSERNEVECSFDSGKRIYRANNIRSKRPETARCWTGMCYFVKNVMKFLRELCLCIRQSLRFLCSIWRTTHSYEFYSNCVWNFFQRTLIKNQKHTKCARLIYFNARPSSACIHSTEWSNRYVNK